MRGRLLVIGSITSYKDGDAGSFKDAWQDSVNTAMLLAKSTSIIGFFLNNYVREARTIYPELVQLIHDGTLEFRIDQKPFTHVLRNFVFRSDLTF